MKIFKYLLSLLVLVFVVNIVLSTILDSLYKQTYTGQTGGKINDFAQNTKHTSILAVGDSRCAHHIVPDLIGENTYNLSHNGMSIAFQAGVIEYILSSEKQIDTLLLHIEAEEYLSPSFEKHNSDLLFLKYFYNKNDFIKSEINKNYPLERIKQLLPLYKWNGRALNILKNRIQTYQGQIPSKGYVAHPQTARDSINVSMTIPIDTLNDNNDSINSEFKYYLSYISNLCSENNVELVCFTSPTFYSQTENKVAYDELDLFFDTLDVKYINYLKSDLNQTELKSEWLWKDASHLNQEGAIILSTILRKDLNTK